VPKFGRKFPHLDATRIPFLKSKVGHQAAKMEVNSEVKGDPPLTLKMEVNSEVKGQGHQARPIRISNLVYGWRTTTCISHRRHTTKFALGTLTKYQDAYDRKSQ